MNTTVSSPAAAPPGKQLGAAAWTLAAGLDYDTATDAQDRLRALKDTGVDVAIVSWPNACPYAFGWDGRQGYDYRQYEALLESLLKANPDLRFLLRFGSLHGAPYYWGYDHKDQLALYHLGERMQQPSLGSKLWRRDSSEAASRFAHHFSQGRWQDRVLGFIPYSTGLNWRGAGETFVNIPDHEVPKRTYDPVEGDFSQPMLEAYRAFLHDRYGSDEALQDAWNSTNVRIDQAELPSRIEVRSPTQAVQDYFACYNRLNAKLALAWCEALKQAAPDKQVILPHGYVFGWPNQNVSPQGSGHNEPEMLLGSDAVDAVMSAPVTRMENRNPLSQHALDSVRLSGTRHVHVLELLNLGEISDADQIAEATLGAGYAAVKGSSLVVAEPRQGKGSMRDAREQTVPLPYESDAVSRHLETLRRWHAERMETPAESVSELAVFISPRGSYQRAMETRFGRMLIEDFRSEVLSRIGLPFDEYHLSDFQAVADRYRAWIFIDCPDMAGRDWEKVKASREKAFFATVGRERVTLEELGSFLDGAGVRRWTAAGDRLFASSDTIVFAATTSGKKTVELPAQATLTDALDGKVLAEGVSRHTFDASAGEVHLWHYAS
ncbi:MAG: hypothetical protein ACOCTI_00015 [Phycisphaeraceae bacterium]